MTDLSPKDYCGTLIRRIWETKSARFNAARRLRTANTYSLFSIAALSIYAIIASVSMRTSWLSDRQRQALEFAILAVSIGVLVLSVLEAGRNYLVRAERFHDVGRELGKLQNEVEIFKERHSSTTEDQAQLSVLSGRYGDIIDRFDDNHEPQDFELVRATEDLKTNGWHVVARFQVGAYWLRVRFWYLFLVVLPPGLLLLWLRVAQ